MKPVDEMVKDAMRLVPSGPMPIDDAFRAACRHAVEIALDEVKEALSEHSHEVELIGGTFDFVACKCTESMIEEIDKVRFPEPPQQEPVPA